MIKLHHSNHSLKGVRRRVSAGILVADMANLTRGVEKLTQHLDRSHRVNPSRMDQQTRH